MNKLKELSIFFPFWNEEKNIERVVASAIPIAEKYADKWEILMVDDGSKDKTYEIALELSSKNKNLKAISHSPNRGYGAALKDGLENSRYDIVVFTDGDGQFDISEVYKFIEEIDDNDLVVGYRKKRKDHKIVKRLFLMSLLKIWD